MDRVLPEPMSDSLVSVVGVDGKRLDDDKATVIRNLATKLNQNLAIGCSPDGVPAMKIKECKLIKEGGVLGVGGSYHVNITFEFRESDGYWREYIKKSEKVLSDVEAPKTRRASVAVAPDVSTAFESSNNTLVRRCDYVKFTIATGDTCDFEGFIGNGIEGYKKAHNPALATSLVGAAALQPAATKHGGDVELAAKRATEEASQEPAVTEDSVPIGADKAAGMDAVSRGMMPASLLNVPSDDLSSSKMSDDVSSPDDAVANFFPLGTTSTESSDNGKPEILDVAKRRSSGLKVRPPRLPGTTNPKAAAASTSVAPAAVTSAVIAAAAADKDRDDASRELANLRTNITGKINLIKRLILRQFGKGGAISVASGATPRPGTAESKQDIAENLKELFDICEEGNTSPKSSLAAENGASGTSEAASRPGTASASIPYRLQQLIKKFGGVEEKTKNPASSLTAESGASGTSEAASRPATASTSIPYKLQELIDMLEQLDVAKKNAEEKGRASENATALSEMAAKAIKASSVVSAFRSTVKTNSELRPGLQKAEQGLLSPSVPSSIASGFSSRFSGVSGQRKTTPKSDIKIKSGIEVLLEESGINAEYFESRRKQKQLASSARPSQSAGSGGQSLDPSAKPSGNPSISDARNAKIRQGGIFKISSGGMSKY